MASATATTEAEQEEDAKTLPEYYEQIFALHQELETTHESTSSDKIQARIREGLIWTETAIRQVNDLSLFSQNEDIEEVSTNEIKFMMLSAYLAYLTSLNARMPRVNAVKKTKLCYRDFIRLCNLYSITNIMLDDEDAEEEEENPGNKNSKAILTSRGTDLNAMASQRQNKIQRFKQKKAMESKLSELKALVEREHVDEEVKREFFLTQAKHWTTVAVEEIDNCNLELQMLSHQENLKQGKPSAGNHSSNRSSTKPFRPFILTSSELQKQVFGAGYPAISTMTVDEFYEQKLKEGTLSESVHGGHSMQNWAADPEADNCAIEKEEREKEEKIERDDEETLQRARAMDDWKDEHRRGDGNRHNKG